MSYTATAIKEFINAGANLYITEKYTATAIKEFVTLAKTKKLKITIRANTLTATALKELAKIGGEYLTIEI